MEAAGLVLGVAGLAGLFSACSSAFQLVQRGRAFGQEYKILETKFGNQELRLRAWGRACGLIDGTAYDARLDEKELRQQLVATLECIKLLLTDAKDLKERYGLSPCTERDIRSSTGSSSSSSSSSTDSSVVQVSRQRRMSGSWNRLLFRRSRPQLSRSVSTISTALWIIEDRDRFGELVKHLKDFIDDLESLTKATEIPRRQMIFVEYEIEAISDVEELEAIEVAREGEDDVVSDAASARLERLSQGTMSIRASMESEFSFQTLESYVTARTHFSRASSIAESEKIRPTATQLAASATPTGRNSGIRTRYKCVVVGEPNTRKTELLKTYTTGQFNATHSALVFEQCVMDCCVDDQDISLELWDTSGQEDYESMLNSTLANADVVIICLTGLYRRGGYSEPDILISTWVARCMVQCPRAKYVIAGIEEPSQLLLPPMVTSGRVIVKDTGEYDYVDCCLETFSGVKELFRVAAETAIQSRKPPNLPRVTRSYRSWRLPWRDGRERPALQDIEESEDEPDEIPSSVETRQQKEPTTPDSVQTKKDSLFSPVSDETKRPRLSVELSPQPIGPPRDSWKFTPVSSFPSGSNEDELAWYVRPSEPGRRVFKPNVPAAAVGPIPLSSPIPENLPSTSKQHRTRPWSHYAELLSSASWNSPISNSKGADFPNIEEIARNF